MLDNAEAPWMESPSVAGQKRSRTKDTFPGDDLPVPSTSQSVPGESTASASSLSTSLDEQERGVKRVKTVPERTVLPKFQKRPNSANSRGSAAQTRSSLPPKPSAGAAQPASSRSVLGVSARLNHAVEPSNAPHYTAALVSRSQSQNVVPQVPQPVEAAIAPNAGLTKTRQELKGKPDSCHDVKSCLVLLIRRSTSGPRDAEVSHAGQI